MNPLQRIHLKHQVLFSLKNNEKIRVNIHLVQRVLVKTVVKRVQHQTCAWSSGSAMMQNVAVSNPNESVGDCKISVNPAVNAYLYHNPQIPNL